MKDILENKLYQEDIERVLSSFDFSALKRKRLLVTGGLGLICSAVVDTLLAYNESHDASILIYVAARDEKRFLNRFGKRPCVKYVPYDAAEPIGFDVKVDYIIHGAGLSSPDLYLAKPVETMLTNFNGILNLLRYARAQGASRTLYISSSEVYGRKSVQRPFREDESGVVDINVVRSSYPESKRASEVLCRAFYSEYGVDSVIVRPGHVYGPAASRKDRRIASEFAYLSAQGKDLEMKSPGLQKRSYCYCLDCAAAILIALLKGSAGESYNIGNDEAISIREMASILAEAGNVGLSAAEPTEEELRRFNPMSNSSINDSKIKALGYKDTFAVHEGLCHTVLILKDLLTND